MEIDVERHRTKMKEHEDRMVKRLQYLIDAGRYSIEDHRTLNYPLDIPLLYNKFWMGHHAILLKMAGEIDYIPLSASAEKHQQLKWNRV